MPEHLPRRPQTSNPPPRSRREQEDSLHTDSTPVLRHVERQLTVLPRPPYHPRVPRRPRSRFLARWTHRGRRRSTGPVQWIEPLFARRWAMSRLPRHRYSPRWLFGIALPSPHTLHGSRALMVPRSRSHEIELLSPAALLTRHHYSPVRRFGPFLRFTPPLSNCRGSRVLSSPGETCASSLTPARQNSAHTRRENSPRRRKVYTPPPDYPWRRRYR